MICDLSRFSVFTTSRRNGLSHKNQECQLDNRMSEGWHENMSSVLHCHQRPNFPVVTVNVPVFLLSLTKHIWPFTYGSLMRHENSLESLVSMWSDNVWRRWYSFYVSLPYSLTRSPFWPGWVFLPIPQTTWRWCQNPEPLRKDGHVSRQGLPHDGLFHSV
jgi:hypothetical protein